MPYEHMSAISHYDKPFCIRKVLKVTCFISMERFSDVIIDTRSNSIIYAINACGINDGRVVEFESGRASLGS